jgi:hypothetical protein
MDSLDAQRLVMQMVEADIPPPDLWHHERSGALTCAYAGGTKTFTWPATDVADMARRWRRENPIPATVPVPAFPAAHERLLALAEEAGLGPPDVVVHDMTRSELRGVWQEHKAVIVVEQVGEASPCG